MVSLLPLVLCASHRAQSVGPRAASVRCNAPRAAASADELPLLVCTTAPSLEGMAFCRQALKSGEYRVRALTRNPSSPRAAALADMGAELFEADNLDQESLRAAFEGAHGVYAITTWSGSSFGADGAVVRADNLNSDYLMRSEVEQGLNIIRAAEETPGLQHFVMQSMHRGGQTPLDDQAHLTQSPRTMP